MQVLADPAARTSVAFSDRADGEHREDGYACA